MDPYSTLVAMAAVGTSPMPVFFALVIFYWPEGSTSTATFCDSVDYAVVLAGKAAVIFIETGQDKEPHTWAHNYSTSSLGKTHMLV